VAVLTARNEFRIINKIINTLREPAHPQIVHRFSIGMDEPTQSELDKTIAAANARQGIHIHPSGEQR
jgi:hypothetical protein